MGNIPIGYYDRLGKEADNSKSCPPDGYELVDQQKAKELRKNSPGAVGGFVGENGTPIVNPFNPVRNGRKDSYKSYTGYFARCIVVEASSKEKEGLPNDESEVWSGTTGGFGFQVATGSGLKPHGWIDYITNQAVGNLGADVSKGYMDLVTNVKMTICWKACKDDGCPKPKCMRGYVLMTIEFTNIKQLNLYGDDKKPLEKQIRPIPKSATAKVAFQEGCI